MVFFIALGAGLNINGLGSRIWQALVLSAFVLIAKPIIVLIIMGILGYTKRTSFKTGLTMAQISEFSLIFLLVGQQHGQVSQEAVALVTVIGIITIAISSYMITYSDQLYSLFERYLSLFERRKVKPEHSERHHYEAILFGYQRGGAKFIKLFQGITKRFVVVDYDPDAISAMHEHEVPYIYGDATDMELLEEIGLGKARLIISNITDHDTNIGILKLLDRHESHAVVICHAETVDGANELYTRGATYVALPHYIGSEQISSFIKRNGLKKSAFKKFREKQLDYLHHHYDEFVKEGNA